ncbi:MAG TPA: hypothetical protein DEA08_01085, partial [Planctomycetes bacterium]|nr:hypothetical protein [Planctomycetota bacterium]
FSFESDWIELEPAEPLRFELRVIDEDLTTNELITETKDPVELPAAALGPEPTRHEVPLRTIGLGNAKTLGVTRVRITGPSVELGVVALPRRDEPDDESRALVRELFAGLLAQEPPRDPAAARALARILKGLPERADARARRSTHTRLRRVLPKLAGQVEGLRQRAVDVGALESVHEQLPKLAQACAARAEDAHYGEHARRLGETCARSAPSDAKGLDALDAELLAAGVPIDLLASRPPWLEDLNEQLSALLRDVRRAKRGLGHRGALGDGLLALQAELRRELGEAK